MPIGPINVLNATRTVVMANAAISRSRKEGHMTYDQAYEKIESLFENGGYSGWELVSPDGLLAVKCKDGIVSFVELEESFDPGLAVLCEKAYRISDYNMQDLWVKSNGWWPTYAEFLEAPLFRKFECMYDHESLGSEMPIQEAFSRYLYILNHH